MPPLDGLSWSVLAATLGVAVLHTALGPDHTLPFLFLARARGWSRPRTLAVTAACGAGHVLSSLVLGLAGLGLGLSLGALEQLESGRGALAGWCLAAFGLAYALWGLRRGLRARRGIRLHAHGAEAHVHAHGLPGHHHRDGADATSWTLFLVFVLGPCEPLIPLVMLPASRGRWGLAAAVAVVFALATIATMTALVALGEAAAERLPLGALERWAHPLAGALVAATGLAVALGGL